MHTDPFDQVFGADLREAYQWLDEALDTSAIDSIVDFGFMSGEEPFALLWTLDANEVVVVEKEDQHRRMFEKLVATLEHVDDGDLAHRSVEFVQADMTGRISGLPSDYFDLAYCADVLYIVHRARESATRHAIAEMADAPLAIDLAAPTRAA